MLKYITLPSRQIESVYFLHKRAIYGVKNRTTNF